MSFGKILLACALLVLSAAAAGGHVQPRPSERELVRIQGYRTETPPQGIRKRLTLRALGVAHSFAATEWQTFGFAASERDDADSASTGTNDFTLQGSREDLARFSAARAEQRITLLAEHRPGSSDLFVVALDLCPPS